MTTPHGDLTVVRPVAERVAASRDRATGLRDRATSLAAQLVGGATAPTPDGGAATPARLLAVQAVAATFYRAQLADQGDNGPGRYLRGRGIPTDGEWVVG